MICCFFFPQASASSAQTWHSGMKRKRSLEGTWLSSSSPPSYWSWDSLVSFSSSGTPVPKVAPLTSRPAGTKSSVPVGGLEAAIYTAATPPPLPRLEAASRRLSSSTSVSVALGKGTMTTMMTTMRTLFTWARTARCTESFGTDSWGMTTRTT